MFKALEVLRRVEEMRCEQPLASSFKCLTPNQSSQFVFSFNDNLIKHSENRETTDNMRGVEAFLFTLK